MFVELNDVVNESILQPFCDVRDISEIHIIESWAMAVLGLFDWGGGWREGGGVWKNNFKKTHLDID